MLVVVDCRDLLAREPLLGANLGAAQGAVKPADPRFDAKLGLRLDRARIVEAAEGDADPVAVEAPVGQRRAALSAEAALGDVGAREGRDGAAGDDEIGKPHAAKGHERTAARLLTHPAMADIGAGRAGVKPIAHRAALASSREGSRNLGRHGLKTSQFQNASARIAISVAAPALSRARCAAVSGSIRSLKNEASVNFASSSGVLSPRARRARTAFTIRAHM